jgi:hypothetical protein
MYKKCIVHVYNIPSFKISDHVTGCIFDNKEITCPKPTVPKPEITIVEHIDKTRKCSYCKETGHEKSRNGNIL